jgi:uroporphyrinogen III methyltransferase / synthase
MGENIKTSGIVYLVGAGPGHPGLITRLGYDLLQQCDAIAYDALIPMELISGLPDGVEKYYVGKRAGKHSLPQSQINDLLLDLAKRGLKVVRLKGGDPFIFGRSGEEAEHLTAAGIPVVMVPGVTAASAAAAMSGFSLTNRQAASWIFLATGHGAESAAIPVPWDRVAALPGGTFVIYMGLAQIDHLIAEILSSGLAPATPAMVIQAASTGIQKSVEAPLSELSRECERQGMKPPALIIIGDAVRHKTAGAMADCAKLAGKRILVTGPAQMAIGLCKTLRENGAEPIPFPTVALKPFCSSDGWARFLEKIDRGGMCLFSSEWDVDYFFDVLFLHGLDARSLSRFKIIAAGGRAESALLRRGIRADQSIEKAGFTGLQQAVDALDSEHSSCLILIYAGSGVQQLESNLRGDFMRLKVSSESTAVWEPHWNNELMENPPDYIVFTSAAEVEGFFELMGPDNARYLADKSCIAALDSPVAEALKRNGLSVKAQANVSTVDALVRALAADIKNA